MNYPENLKYTKDHEYVRLEGNKAYVGITFYAQDQLGDVVFVELPELGTEVKQGEVLATVESVKAVSDVYAPVSGTIVEINEELNDSPEIVNNDPYGEGWICAIELSNLSEVDALMGHEEYRKLVEEGGD
ncbi:MAG TPA: glycine cleavage system protein GcvH [Bacillota bacterium]|jgi:glycine cleavage system H protein|nr:glycine cleavage system protein GcvH [Candidatus Fermentithermobacillaceae bacterium]HOB30609.1 glycine cleavage system protein GcvH [Bacillota bacterium]HOK64475.1 glycine cleavage system protein GcvH [Bacillota bacterium]HOL11761.1 glycine cleavage system protein GcvH [Bacillota bacterium]HOQ02325.1 glycine cleavage system protein GcvH [Bacillota bacterium]